MNTELAHDGAVEDSRIETRRQTIVTHAEGLRAAGVWLSKNAEALAAIGLGAFMDDSYMAIGGVDSEQLTIYVYGEDQRAMLAEVIAQIGGAWNKDYGDAAFILSQVIAGKFKVRFWADREKVCVAKVVGTEEVEVTDYEAVKELPKKKVSRDVIEWECAPLIGGETSTEGKV